MESLQGDAGVKWGQERQQGGVGALHRHPECDQKTPSGHRAKNGRGCLQDDEDKQLRRSVRHCSVLP